MARELIITVEADTSKAHAAFQTLDADIDKTTQSATQTGAAVDKLGTSFGGANAGATSFHETIKQIAGDTFTSMANASDKLGQTIMRAFTDPIGSIKAFASELGSSVMGAIESSGLAIAGFITVLGGLGVVLAGMAEKAIGVGAALNDLSDKTGASVPGLSHLSDAAKVAGGSIEQITNAMFLFQRGVGEDSSKITDGLGKIGLTFDEIKRLAPEDQFAAIAKGFKDTEDPTVRAAAAMELFGRQGRDLLPILVKMDQALLATNDIKPWTEEQAKDAEQFEMQMASMKVHAEAWAGSIGRDLIPALSSFVSVAKDVTVFLGEWALKLSGVTSMWSTLVNVWQTGSAALDVMRGKGADLPTVTGQASRDLAANTPHMDQLPVLGITNEKEYIRDLNRTHEEQLKAARAADELTKARERLAEATWKATEASIEESRAERNSAMTAIAKSFGGQNVLRDLGVQMGDIQLGGAKQIGSFQGSLMPDFSAQAQARADEYMGRLSEGKTVVDALAGSFGKLSQVIIATFTGGGNLTGALKALGTTISDGLFGEGGPLSNITSKLGGLVTKATGFLGESFSKVFGSAISSILPGIGGLVAPLFDWIKNLGGPSKQEVAGRQVEGDFEKSFGGFQQMMDAVGKAYAATGRSAQQAQADVKALIDAEKLGGDAAKAMVDKISLAFNEQKQDAADLDAAIKKYGFTIDELGPKMRKQQLDEQALGLINDWRLLVGSGIEVATVNAKMTQATQDYLNVARRTGAEVPAAMKPVLQSMIDQGVLVDADGKKITDLTGIGVTFSETMTAGFDRVVAKLQQLLVGLGLVPKALDNIPDSKTITIDYDLPRDLPGWGTPMNGTGENFPGAQSFAATGGLVTDHGIQHFANGGRVLGFRPMPRDTDTVPAMLTPGEMVLTQRQQAAMGLSSGQGNLPRDASSGSGGGDLHVHLMMDSREVTTAVVKNFRLNKGSAYTQARGALGLAS